MTTVILVIHLLLAISLIGVVLLQRSEGGGLGIGGGGGMGGFLTGRSTANLLTRATAALAGGFMLTSLVLALIANRSSAPTSILDTEPPPAASEPAKPAEEAPSGPSVPLAN
jgi:preprotein translocase subunit SecG